MQDRELLRLRIGHAQRRLEAAGHLTNSRSTKLSVRVDPGLVEAARQRTGLESDTELVNAALALIAGDDQFGAWLVSQRGTLDSDFELAI